VRQTTLLARTFFVKLFESELMPAGLPQVQLIIWSVVLIATPTLTLPGVYSQKYTGLFARPGTGMLSMAINTDRLVLITFAMIALGFVALVVWEGAFPDRRDARILGVLPVSTLTFVSARVLAVGALFALFFATLGRSLRCCSRTSLLPTIRPQASCAGRLHNSWRCSRPARSRSAE
jgi:hypothetical protein